MADEQPDSASRFVPPGATLPELREAVEHCRACNLCRLASGPVFGEGNPQARIMLVGEQPGDEEDLRKRPFVGPAGKVLDQAFEVSGILRPDVYVTNAVKAFRFEERGKRRIHQTPRNSDISVCRPWLLAELKAVQPDIIVCLGATAAQSVLGRKVTIGHERGRLIDTPAARVAVTYHPSAVLRSPDEAAQQELFNKLAADLAAVSSDQRNQREESQSRESHRDSRS
jgi:DNA polymerase